MSGPVFPPAPGRRGRPADTSPACPVPDALEIARVLTVLEREEETLLRCLAELQRRTVEALAQLGYQEIDAHLAAQPPTSPEVGVAATLSVIMKLPGSDLRRSDFSLSLPLVLTRSGELRVSGAEIGGVVVRETFVYPLKTDPAGAARALTHGLSRLYLAHLLRTRLSGDTMPDPEAWASPFR